MRSLYLAATLVTVLLVAANEGRADAQQGAASGSPLGTTSLADLGLPEQRAVGTQPAIELFFPGNGDFRLGERSRLVILLQQSTLVASGSTVTVSLNDRPVASIALLGGAAAQHEIEVPNGLVRRDFNRVALQYAMTRGVECDDPLDPALWSVVGRQSFFELGFRDTPPKAVLQTATLSDYPYPFARGGYPVAAPVALVVPPAPTTDEIASAYRIGLDLVRRVASATTVLDVRTSESLRDSDLAARHLIVIGTPERQPLLVRAMGDGGALRGRELVRSGQPLRAGDGYLGLGPSPWNTELRLLTVTGTTSDGVARAVDALTARPASGLLVGTEAFLLEPIARGEELRPARVTFAERKVHDRVVRGLSADVLDVPFDVPTPAREQRATVTLQMTTPETIDDRRSSVAVELNGAMVTSIRLAAASERKLYEFELHGEQLRAEGNLLRLRTTLYPPERNLRCENVAAERLWSQIHRDSSIMFQPSGVAAAELGQPKFDDIPSPFAGDHGLRDLLIVVDAARPASLRGGLLAAIALGRRSSSLTFEVALADTSVEAISGKHVVAVGLPRRGPVGSALADALPLVLSPGVTEVRARGNPLLAQVAGTSRLAAAQTVRAPWNRQRAALALDATDDVALAWATEALATRTLTGTVAIFRSATQVDTLLVDELAPDVQGGAASLLRTRAGLRRAATVFVAATGTALLVLAVWAFGPKLVAGRPER